MRLQQYLTELKMSKSKFYEQFPEGKDNPEFYVWYSQMYKDCKPYLDILSKGRYNHHLYRGMSPNTNFGIKTPRTDRAPKDTIIGIHNELDRVLDDQFDWKPRSQGLFTSTSIDDAMNYGEVYIVLPAGKFKYIWATGVSDSYTYFTTDVVMDYVAKHYKVKNGRELYLYMYGPNGKISNKGYWFMTNYGMIPTKTVTTDIRDEGKAEKDLLSQLGIKTTGGISISWYSYTLAPKNSGGVSLDGRWNFKDIFKAIISDPNNHEYDELKEYIVSDLLDKKIHYQDDNLDGLLVSSSSVEVIIKCDKYYYIDINSSESYWLNRMIWPKSS